MNKSRNASLLFARCRLAGVVGRVLPLAFCAAVILLSGLSLTASGRVSAATPDSYCSGCAITADTEGSTECTTRTITLPSNNSSCSLFGTLVLGQTISNCQEVGEDCLETRCSVQWSLRAKSLSHNPPPGCSLTSFRISTKTSAAGNWQLLNSSSHPAPGPQWTEVASGYFSRSCDGGASSKYFRLDITVDHPSPSVSCASNEMKINLSCTKCVGPGIDPN